MVSLTAKPPPPGLPKLELLLKLTIYSRTYILLSWDIFCDFDKPPRKAFLSLAAILNNLWFFLDLPWQQFVVVLIDRAATTLLCSQSKMSLCDSVIIDNPPLPNVSPKVKELFLPSICCSMLPLTVRVCYATDKPYIMKSLELRKRSVTAYGISHFLCAVYK